MPSDLLADARGLVALAALLLLPGLLVVRAPWTAVPFLSAGFWVLTWFWLPSVGRERFLASALLTFLLLALLRVLPPWRVRWPRWPTVLVVTVAAARLLPFFVWPTAPGAEASFQAVSTLLMVWRDGLPVSYEPLFPLRAFSAYPHGAHGLAADVALLAGLAAYRAAWLVRLVGEGLLAVALYALLARRLGSRAAALAAVLALALARVPTALAACGEPFVLALAFGLAAAGLLAGHREWPSAVAGGFVLAAATACHPLAAAVTLAVLVVAARGGMGGRGRRPALALAAAFGAGAPFLWRLRPAVSGLEGERLVSSLGIAEIGRAFLALAALACIPALVAWLLPRKKAAARLVLVLAGAAALEAMRRDLTGPGPEARPGPDDLAAMTWIRAHTPALALFCGASGTAGVWVPALAYRSLEDPWVPFLYRDEQGVSRGGSCDYAYHGRTPPSRPPGSGEGQEAVLFRNATVTVTSFHRAGRTPVPGPP